MNRTSTTVKPKMTYDELLGRIIEHRRKHRGLLQKPIADALDITQSAYSRLEKGQSAMSVSQLRIIASHVHASGGQLLNEADHYAGLFQRQGGELIREKQEPSAAGFLVALGILTAILAAAKK
jgi:transcriptional regulator with XRE-family HTH domain